MFVLHILSGYVARCQQNWMVKYVPTSISSHHHIRCVARDGRGRGGGGAIAVCGSQGEKLVYTSLYTETTLGCRRICYRPVEVMAFIRKPHVQYKGIP